MVIERADRSPRGADEADRQLEPAGAAAIEARGVRVTYGDRVAVDDLTLTVPRGEVLGVLGPNGAGKTTAIRALTTLLRPSRGTFAVAGFPHDRPHEIRARIGVLPESAGYPEHQTGGEFLRYHARLHGLARGEARDVAERLLAEFGLADRGGSLIAGYSRGMRQRLGIARALVNDPEVVFLDEPTLGLDPAGQLQVLGYIRSIASERGATVLLCTHLLSEIEEVCTRVLILNRGRVTADGTVAEVTGLAAAPRSVRLRVPADLHDRAVAMLRQIPEVERVQEEDGRAGLLTVTLSGAPELGGSAVLRAFAEAGLPVRSYELEGARLSDAFFAVTGDER